MAAVAVGQISEFQSELESITVYLERVGQYFIANEIPTGRRVAVLLSVIGSRTYSLLRSLLHPEVPGEKTYDQLETALREHFEPKRLVVVERFQFNRRNQGNGESVLEYVAEIKRLAGTCTFGEFLTEALRDRFVCGLTNESIQRRLLSEANLDFEKAVQIARGMETAQKNSQVVQASEGRVQKFQDHVSSRTQGGQGCRHCGKRGHQAEHCRFKNAVCYRCHKKGHIEAKCKTRQDKEETKWKELSKVMRYLQNGWPEMVTAELQPYEAKKTELTIENHTLLWGMRVVIPRKLQAKVLSELHQNHPGMSRMKSLARSHVWWPNIDRDIEACVRACECCQAIKQSIPLAPMQPWTWPERPWQRVHVDFAGPFLGKMFFLLMDAHSKWPEVYEMTSTTAQKTVDILRHIFAAYGLPEQLVSDNGPQFVAKEFEDFMLKNGIRHIRSAPYHPATNGLVERFVQSFKRAMETGKNSGQTLQHRLSSFLLAYRSSPHSVTNVSPCSLFLQRELRTKLDLLRQTTEQIVRKKQEEQKEGHDKNTRERVFEQNDIVWASNFGVGERWVKGKIKQSSGPSSYLVELADGREWRRHIDHLRRAEGGVRKTEGIKSEIDDQQMMQPDKEVINKEKRAVEPAPEEAGEVQIDQDETPTEVEENEDKTMEREPEVPVAGHRYQLRQNRRPPDRY